jgi:hypothetical protein
MPALQDEPQPATEPPVAASEPELELEAEPIPDDSAPITAEVVAELAVPSQPAKPAQPAAIADANVSAADISPVAITPSTVAPSTVAPSTVAPAGVSPAGISPPAFPAPTAPAGVRPSPVTPHVSASVERSVAEPSDRYHPLIETDGRRAAKLQMLFGDARTELQERYAQLAKAEADLLELEAAYQRVLERLGEEQLTARDTLTRLEREIDTTSNSLAQLRRELNQSQRKQQQLARDAASVAFQLGSLLSADRGRQHREQRRRLDAELARLSAAMEETQSQLETRQQQYAELTAPLKQFQQESEELAELRVAAYQAIGAAHQRIDGWISDQLRRLPTAELQRRLRALADDSPLASVLPVAADELVRAVAELERHAAEMSAAESDLEQAAAAAAASSDSLGEVIAAGFRLDGVQRRTDVQLNGSLEFHEQRGTFSGFHGVAGTASGTGNGHATYAVDELQWNLPADFDGQVNTFVQAWARSGDAAARHELSRRLVAACRRCIEDLARLVRAELEREPAGGHPR